MNDKMQKGGIWKCRIYVWYFDLIDHVAYQEVGEAYKVVNKFNRVSRATPLKIFPWRSSPPSLATVGIWHISKSTTDVKFPQFFWGWYFEKNYFCEIFMRNRPCPKYVVVTPIRHRNQDSRKIWFALRGNKRGDWDIWGIFFAQNVYKRSDTKSNYRSSVKESTAQQ